MSVKKKQQPYSCCPGAPTSRPPWRFAQLETQRLRNHFLRHRPNLTDADRRTNDGGDEFIIQGAEAMQVLFSQLSKPFQVSLGRIEVIGQEIAAMAKPEGKTNPLMGGAIGSAVELAAN